ncbi:etoposide-induced protein 2.4 homolog isoform X2 [Hermetia illucens]|nr:etoposide-induced protein 2.4 homolog isoform X2 [Hermetia illucens]XP_037913457.1 etoposide-induced protein 2.4 homolog isoform X2 [Hermetia illucens]
MKRVVQCCALNGGIFWLSIVVFEYGLLPTMELLLKTIFGSGSGLGSMLWSWMHPFLSIIFQMIWVLPLFLLSKIVNSLWFQDIADSAYKFRKGRPQPIVAFSKIIADTLFSLLVQVLFLVQSMLVSLIPISYVGTALAFLHISLLYSLYSFEYKWYNMGWELHKRLSFIENNWPYFLGFGMPLTILTQMPNSYIISGCVFSIAFPIFILSGNEANPFVGSCDFPLKLFSPVVFLTNLVFNRSVRVPRPPQTKLVTKTSARSSPMRRSTSSMSSR